MARDGALEVHLAALRQGAEVRPAQSFWRDADHEGVVVELCDGQAGAVDGDGVAEVAVVEDFGGRGDSEGGAACLILRVELGDNCKTLAMQSGTTGLGYIPPRISTMPVNMISS